MKEYTTDAVANREEPIPAIAILPEGGGSSDRESGGEGLKKIPSNSRLRDKIHDAITGKSESGNSLPDRLISKVLQQILPVEDLGESSETRDERSSKYSNRPGFSLPLMTNNFRRFNARIGIVFVLQNRIIRLLFWKTTSHTLSLLALSTFVCLNPYLLAVLPVAVVLLFIMVPSFLIRHPPPPPVISHTSYSISGPPLAPPRTIRPASETSKDFFRNMRDLQNTMEDFSVLHDTIMKAVTPLTNFSNEALSSTMFLFLFVTSCLLFMVSHLLPWRAVSLISCWMFIMLGHPNVQRMFWTNREEYLKPHERRAQSWLDHWITQDIILDAKAETREVEIFELERRKGGVDGEWEPWMFSPSSYDPMSPQRISGDRPKGTRFFEDVEAPDGWEWGDKKWVLDMESKEWVEERMIQGVQIEIEGERWVYDLQVAQSNDDSSDGKTVTKGKERAHGWEEGDGLSVIGEWRRRRWIRTVRRKVIGSREPK